MKLTRRERLCVEATPEDVLCALAIQDLRLLHYRYLCPCRAENSIVLVPNAPLQRFCNPFLPEITCTGAEDGLVLEMTLEKGFRVFLGWFLAVMAALTVLLLNEVSLLAALFPAALAVWACLLTVLGFHLSCEGIRAGVWRLLYVHARRPASVAHKEMEVRFLKMRRLIFPYLILGTTTLMCGALGLAGGVQSADIWFLFPYLFLSISGMFAFASLPWCALCCQKVDFTGDALAVYDRKGNVIRQIPLETIRVIHRQTFAPDNSEHMQWGNEHPVDYICLFLNSRTEMPVANSFRRLFRQPDFFMMAYTPEVYERLLEQLQLYAAERSLLDPDGQSIRQPVKFTQSTGQVFWHY